MITRRFTVQACLGAALASLFLVLANPAQVAQATSGDWTTYHHDNFRSGSDPAAVPFAGPIVNRWSSPPLGGTIYAEPLQAGNLLIVADEGDVVTALNAGTGGVVWQRRVGNPVTLAMPPFECGGISPLGITSTPVIDPVAGIVFAVAFEQPANYYLVGLDLKSGAPRFPQVLIAPLGFDPYHQQQRAALALANGRVYVAFGGYAGDCGTYHGWVVGLPTSGSGAQVVFRDDPAGSGANEAGIWAPAGPSVDSNGNLYVTSGNGGSTSRFDNGNTIFKLSAGLGLVDWWAPSAWAPLNGSDTDLGSVGPAIVGASHNLVFQIGKSGWGYLLNSILSSPGGNIGREPFSAQVCSAASNQTAAGDQVFGGIAYSDPYIYVPCPEGIVALKLAAGPSFTIAWTSSATFQAGPPIVAGGVVWTLDISQGSLFGLDPITGATRFGPTPIGSMTHFTTPTYALGRVYVGTGDQVLALGQPRADRTTPIAASTARPRNLAPPPVPTSSPGGRGPFRPGLRRRLMW